MSQTAPLPINGRPGRVIPRRRATGLRAVCCILALSLGGCGDEGGSPVSRGAAGAKPFVDVARQVGLDFVHVNGAFGKRYFPEVMGGGCAFLDYDGDGHQDILMVNSTHWSPANRKPGDPPETMALYRNDGRGNFTNVSRQTGMDIRFYGLGVAVGDYDGDGDPDVVLTGIAGNRLMRNDGGRFTDATKGSGLAGYPDDYNTSAGFFDADGDGDLDLFICNYVLWSKQLDNEIGFRIEGYGRVYSPPWTWEGRHCHFFRNLGDGTFRDDSKAAGIQLLDEEGKPAAKALAIVFFDYDRDGDFDVYVCNDTERNFLLTNDGSGKFRDLAFDMGVAMDTGGRPTGAMGVDIGDLHNDGGLAIGVGNWSTEANSLFMRRPRDRVFVDRGRSHGIGVESIGMVTFGFFFFDYDLDGRLDAFQTNGGLEEEGHRLDPPMEYAQRSQLFRGVVRDGKGTFAEVPPEEAGDVSLPVVGRGAAYADIDADGDLDVLVAQIGRPAVLLRNEQRTGHHWLRVLLEGSGMNREAVGAVVELQIGDVTQRRFVSRTRSYCTQVELPVTFGLGNHDKIDALRVRWPDGARQEVRVDGVDRLVVVRKQP